MTDPGFDRRRDATPTRRKFERGGSAGGPPAANDDEPDAMRALADDCAFGLLRAAPTFSACGVAGSPLSLKALAAIALMAAFGACDPSFAVAVLNVAASAFFLAAVSFRLTLFASNLGPGGEADAAPALADGALPVVTVLLPVHKERDGLPLLAAAMARLDYPPERLDFKLLLEPDDAATIAEARRLGLDRRFDFVFSPGIGPKTKPKACNAGLARAFGELVVIYDAEDAPEPDQLRKAAAAFAAGDERLACVQARLNFYNRRENLLTALFSLEYALWFDYLLPGLQRLGLPIPLGGTSNVFRADVLRAVGGWDPFNVTEDADLGLRLARSGYRTEVLDSTTYEEANCRIGNWLRQRSRWMKGYMQTWLVQMRDVRGFARACGLKGVLSLQFFVAGNFIGALVAPILVALAAGSLLAGAEPPRWVGALGLAALLAGNLLIAGLAAAAPARRGWTRLLPFAILAPFYWQLASLGAFMGLVDLFARPHYWEKTRHVVSVEAKARRAAALAGEGVVASGGEPS